MVPAESMWIACESSASSTILRKTISAAGERQIFPMQMKRTRKGLRSADIGWRSSDMLRVSALAAIANLFLIPLADATPNVIVVITDDQGYGDLSAHGNPDVNTPAL